MKMKPILFNTEMVRAILEGSKTVTRRVVKIPPYTTHMYLDIEKRMICQCGDSFTVAKAPYKVGDILYVRETWVDWSCSECDWDCVGDNGYGHCDMPKYLYKASTYDEIEKDWKPSIHMPKEAARIFLRVTSVRVEMLQDITREDMEKEGLIDFCKKCRVESEFIELWNSTIKPKHLNLYSWEANPYVWVIEFEKILEDEINK